MIFMVTASGCSGSKPDSIGIKNGRLTDCPKRPNCVSSYATDDRHRVEPFQLAGNSGEKWSALGALVGDMPRTRIIENANGYIHAECRSRLFRFVDDLELLLNAETGTVNVRSASRVGHSDLGVNRKRIEAIRGNLIDRGIIRE